MFFISDIDIGPRGVIADDVERFLSQEITVLREEGGNAILVFLSNLFENNFESSRCSSCGMNLYLRSRENISDCVINKSKTKAAKINLVFLVKFFTRTAIWRKLFRTCVTICEKQQILDEKRETRSKTI